MGTTKKEAFSVEQNDLAQVAKALAHPARIAILQHLMKVNSCICGDLVDVLPLAQATVSQHLRELKKVGILKGNVEGTSVCYCIDGQRWQQIQGHLNQLFDLNKGPDCC